MLQSKEWRNNNISSEISLSGVWGRVGYTETLSLPCGGREAIFERPLVQVHQTQVKEEENDEESIPVERLFAKDP